MKELVVVDGLTKVFAHGEDDVVVLKGIDLVIEEGEMLSVVGQSGAGKSTLLHLLGTLDLPTSGRILYDDRDVTKYSSARLAQFRNESIGFVFQFHHLLPEFTALENVMMPGLIRGTPRPSMEKRARALLEEVGLAHRVTHRPGELSGGEQQRVALARAIVMNPRLVLADEPTGNLDSQTSEAIHRLFFELNESRGTTFLIVTHNRGLAERMPRVLTMQDGRIERDQRRPDAGTPYRRAEVDAGTPAAEGWPSTHAAVDAGAAEEAAEEDAGGGDRDAPGEAPPEDAGGGDRDAGEDGSGPGGEGDPKAGEDSDNSSDRGLADA